jgi:hypothetical protein
MADDTATDNNKFAALAEAHRLLDAGLARCRASCKRILPVEEIITLYYQRTLIIAVCPECFSRNDLLIAMASEGLNFTLKPRSSLITIG